MTDRTIQLKIFRDDDDEPRSWLEWRNVDLSDFLILTTVIRRIAGEPMNRGGD